MSEGEVVATQPAVEIPQDPEAVRIKLHDLRLRVDAGQEVTPEELLQALKLLHGDLRARASGMVPAKAKKAAPISVKIDLKAILAARVTKASG